MNDHTPDTVGVDISKAHLDVHRRASGDSARFANDAAGFEALASWLGDTEAWVVYESTGPWHRAFEEALAGRLRLACVNAMRARRFAQAMGQEAKTDAVDARVLATMGAAVELRRVEVLPQARRDLDELQTARDGLVKDRTAALNRQKHARRRLPRRQIKNRLDQIGRQIKALDAEVAKLIATDEEMSRKARVLTSIPGIAQVTAAGLLSEMPELGRIDAKAAASLAGLAPVTRESGEWIGPQLHPRRTGATAAHALHGGGQRRPPQPGPRPQVRGAARARQAVEGGPDGDHAQDGGAGQRAAEAGSAVDAEPRHRDRLSRCPRCSCGGLRPRRRERQRPQPRPKANRRPSPSPAIARRDGFAMPVSNPSAPTDEHPKARYPGLGEHPQRNTSLTTWILTSRWNQALPSGSLVVGQDAWAWRWP